MSQLGMLSLLKNGNNLMGFPMTMHGGRGYATDVATSGWSTTDKGSGVAVSADSKTATYPGGAVRMVRGAQVKQSGKRYAEIKMNGGASAANHSVGLATSSALLTGYVGSDAFGWGATNQSGALVGLHSNSFTPATGPAATVTSIVMVFMDDSGNLWLGADGSWFSGANPAAGTSPTYTGVSISVYLAGSTFEASNDVINTGGSAFVYPIPSGAVAWG